MPKMTFVCEHQHPINKDSNLSKVTYESNREYLYDILEDFEDFLRGCGFYINGKLEVVDKEDVKIDLSYDSMSSDFSSVNTDTITISSYDDPFNLNLNGS